MLTLALLTLWEIALYTLPDSDLPDAATGGVLALILWIVAFMGAVDVRGGFIGRLAFVFAIAWYVSSIGRWAVLVDAVYQSSGDAVGLVLSAAFLVLAPLGLLVTAFAGPAAHAVNRFRDWRRE